MGRRMTVVRLKDGRLWIHSSIRLQPADLEWLKAQGEAAYVVVPNIFHGSDAPWMLTQFPNAQLFVPAAKHAHFVKQGLKPLSLGQFPQISGELLNVATHGSRVDESVFLHVPSKTLILCDLAFNMGDVFSGFEKRFMGWNKVGGQFGPSRLTKLVFTKNRRAMVDSYRRILEWDFDRVVVNHGDVLETGGKPLLRAGIERIFGKL